MLSLIAYHILLIAYRISHIAYCLLLIAYLVALLHCCIAALLYCCIGLSTRTSMRNLDSVTQEMSELCCSALMLLRQSVTNLGIELLSQLKIPHRFFKLKANNDSFKFF